MNFDTFNLGWEASRTRTDAAIIRAIESFTTELDIDIQRLEKEYNELMSEENPTEPDDPYIDEVLGSLQEARKEKHKFAEIVMRIAVEIENPITVNPDTPSLEEWQKQIKSQRMAPTDHDVDAGWTGEDWMEMNKPD